MRCLFIKKLVFSIFVLVILLLLLLTYRGYKDNVEADHVKNPESSDINLLENCGWGARFVLNDSTYETEKKIKIAIVDSGISDHPAIANKIVESYNLIESEDEKDYLNHGTAIAGIIAGEDEKVCGINPNVSLYNVKVLDEKGNGDVQDLIKGIEWAILKDVDIINISFGTPNASNDLKNIIDKANEKGIIVVASAGNKYGLNVDYPAKYENVISIGSINKDLKKSIFGAAGKIDFVLPGEGIDSINHSNGAQIYDGTSFSTAFASGIISALLSQNEMAKNEETFEEIMAVLSSKTLYSDGDSEELEKYYGKGILTLN